MHRRPMPMATARDLLLNSLWSPSLAMESGVKISKQIQLVKIQLYFEAKILTFEFEDPGFLKYY